MNHNYIGELAILGVLWSVYDRKLDTKFYE